MLPDTMMANLDEFILEAGKPGFPFVIVVEQGEVKPVHPIHHLVIQLRAATNMNFLGMVGSGAFQR
ncbi:hypothetical protein PS720_04811 [Pseudomonas fluorescens]|nr:hypothetical protein PS720_04811 [Pseudomonas fluorescens]